jgi:hypothetical protein
MGDISTLTIAECEDNTVAANDAQSVLEIWMTNDLENYDRKYYMKYHAGTKHKADCAVELLCEVDEMGSFVEDQKLSQSVTGKHSSLKHNIKNYSPGPKSSTTSNWDSSIAKASSDLRNSHGVNIQKLNRSQGER